jgi:hypothetical protein
MAFCACSDVCLCVLRGCSRCRPRMRQVWRWCPTQQLSVGGRRGAARRSEHCCSRPGEQLSLPTSSARHGLSWYTHARSCATGGATAWTIIWPWWRCGALHGRRRLSFSGPGHEALSKRETSVLWRAARRLQRALGSQRVAPVLLRSASWVAEVVCQERVPLLARSPVLP